LHPRPDAILARKREEISVTTEQLQKELQRVLGNWRDERNGAALYEALAATEKDARLARIFGKLAASEREHAAYWETRLRANGCAVPAFSPSLRVRVLAALARVFGSAFVIPSVTAGEIKDRDKYAGQDDARAAGLSTEESGHAAVMQAMARHGGALSGEQIASAEQWHRGTSGSDLRAAVLGANDGLVSNFCLVMGVAGGGAQTSTILLTGVAGLIAGACSMALGEWLSVTNAREMAQSQVDKEAEELRENPEAEKRELALIYEAKGLSEENATRLAGHLMADENSALDTLVREELGIDPSELGGNPWRAAGISFALFALGAIIPVLPFFLFSSAHGVAATLVLSLAALFALGVVTALFNGRTALFSGSRQMLIGAAAAALTYLAGVVFGAAVS
jgi:VIT1/CCC1 family predicted Fe2+/Mn2+ transporter